ncbi:MAG TPA: DUF6220 domain-containing protein [Pseudonocardiaceae bacterium]|jgi:hypothetical protein|nr:DUF6220 domain-containing protein [Pseudonocardiaceae bacterium]
MVDETTSQVTTTPRRGPLQALRIGSMVFGTAVLVQFYLAGSGIFAATGPVKDANSLDAHRLFGNILAGLALIVLIIAIVARPPARVLIATIAMLVLTAVEGLIAGLDDTSPYLAALHPVVAAVILGLAFVIPLWIRPLVKS